MMTTLHWARNLAEFWPKSAITWAIIGKFDNFGQIKAFMCNFCPIYGLECYNRSQYTDPSPSIGPKLSVKA